MYFTKAIIVPANTPKDEPVSEDLPLAKGVVVKVEAQFPVGCQELAHCIILHSEHQIIPTNLDGDLSSDGYVIEIPEEYELKTQPYLFRVVCWNDDEAYQHQLTIRASVLKGEAGIFLYKVLKGMATFLRLTGVKV